ncbi:MAG TPA: DUF456 domain-containing protein [Arenimonas sp.]|uniref:DUF456 domain-containing protein n=1 Tax=Arenimonas sp. TaxID=1872635 RepID=UPI002C642FCF|nr:DUF456 domain-containing protein [Arenimonas sp.]HMB56414.1 DUF456 domain-containing protein [Arenimonas sp.]
MDSHFLLYLISGLLIVIGLAGIILPALPGLPVMFAGMLLAAWTDDFSKIGFWTLLLLGLLTVIALAVDIFASLFGAKRAGASKLALFGAAIGTLVGLFFGIPGILLGPFLGAVIGELIAGKAWREASKVGFATWLGLAIGTALKLALAFAMLGIFAIALLWN